jgi:DNA-nicking Smr family endonuclease
LGKRGGKGKVLPDFHLWTAVSRTVDPLPGKRHLLDLNDTPLPMPEPPAPPAKAAKQAVPRISMPAYQSQGRPGRQAAQQIEPGMRKRLQRGHIPIDGTIDLHGMRQVEAEAALTRFIKARVQRGDRTILVITGKGLKKLDDDAATIVERGVLRSMLPIWLSAPQLAPFIAGWEAAAQGHGGQGAFYVRLRRVEP